MYRKDQEAAKEAARKKLAQMKAAQEAAKKVGKGFVREEGVRRDGRVPNIPARVAGKRGTGSWKVSARL